MVLVTRLIDHGPSKIRVIKQLRQIFRLTLADAKDLTDRVPCDLPRKLTDAEILALTDIGAQVDDVRRVKVRVAVAVDPDGNWSVADTLEPGEARYYLTATLPVPSIPEVEADVEEEGSE